MNRGSVAIRYSRALFEEASAQSIDKDVYGFLTTLQDNMHKVPDLQRALMNQRVSKEKKLKLLVTASGLNPDTLILHSPSGGEVRGSLYIRFLWLVLEHQREAVLRVIILIYFELYRAKHHIVNVILETAMAASDELQQRVKDKIYALTGLHVQLETRVRPELIGGFCLRVGDILYDYSYRSKLQTIRKRLWNK